jgi:hypothetical protein
MWIIENLCERLVAEKKTGVENNCKQVDGM